MRSVVSEMPTAGRLSSIRSSILTRARWIVTAGSGAMFTVEMDHDAEGGWSVIKAARQRRARFVTPT